MALSTEYLNAASLVLGYCSTQSETFTAPGAGTFPSGTIVSRSGSNVVPYVRGGAAPVGVLLADVVATGAGPFPCSMILSGLVRADQLRIQGGTAVGWQEYDLLRAIRIVPNRALELRPITPDIDPGFALLTSAFGWFSTQSMTVVERSQTIAAPGATNSLTVLTGQPDPWGGTTALAYQSVAATAAHWARFDTTGLATGEEWTCSIYVKPNGTALINTRPRMLLNATAQQCDFYTESPEAFVLYANGANGVRTKLEKKAGGWWLCELTFVSDGSQQHYFALQGNATIAGTGAIDLWITPPVFARREVSAMANLGGVAAACAQATAASRPVARPNWGTLDALAFDGETNSLPVTGVPAAWSGAGTALSFGVVLAPVKASTARGIAPTEGAIFRLTGATASLELRLTAAGVLTLRLTDDAATATVATLPVTCLFTQQVIYIVRNGASVQLYVQGVALGAPQTIGAGAATFTACTIGGTTLLANVVEVAFHDEVLTDSHVAQASSYLASRAQFSTAPIPLYRGRSQSNGMENIDVSELPEVSQVPAPFAMLRAKNSTDAVIATQDWGAVRPRISDGSAGATNRAYSCNAGAGAAYTWGMSQQLGRAAFCHFGRNGTAISEFLSTGSLWAEGLAFDQDATADLVAGGIPYYEAGLVLFFGENDSLDTTRANAFAAKVEQLRTDMQTALGVSLPVVIMPRLSNLLTLSPYAERDMLRANEVAWQAANATARVLVDIDNLPLKADNVHLSSTSSLEAGKRLGAQAPRAT